MTEPPAELMEQVRELREGCGVDVEVTRLDTNRWRLSIRNLRVYMETDFRTAKRGRTVWLRSALYVDGERRPLARGPEHFMRIFNDPDTEAGPAAEPDPILPQVPPDTAPAIVRHFYARLARALGAENVGVGTAGRNWQISITGKRGGLRFRFVNFGRRRVGPAGGRWIQVVIDGVDRSDEAQNDLENALAMFAAPTIGPAQPGTEGAPATGAGYDSVGVRRHSVMRN
jgi:hypothetical protein